MTVNYRRNVDMQTVQVTIAASKETYELGQGLGKFIKVVKAQLADGFQLGQDGTAILASLMTDLAPALNGVDQISDEAKNTPEFQNACYLTGQEIYSALK